MPHGSFPVGEITAQWGKNRGYQVYYTPSLTSTSDLAKESAGQDISAQSPPSFWITEEQSLGRGRKGSRWENSSPGHLLLMTWSFGVKGPLSPTLSPKFGLAVIRSLTSTFPDLPFSLKAPNDVYLENAKVAGLLVESVAIGDKSRLLLGLGLNVFSHPSSVALSTHLQWHLKQRLNKTIWYEFLTRFEQELQFLLEKSQNALDENDRATLLYYLNLCPRRPQNFLSVTLEGSLKAADETIYHWMEL